MVLRILSAKIKLRQGVFSMPPEFNCAVCESLVASNDFGLCRVCGWEGDLYKRKTLTTEEARTQIALMNARLGG